MGYDTVPTTFTFIGVFLIFTAECLDLIVMVFKPPPPGKYDSVGDKYRPLCNAGRHYSVFALYVLGWFMFAASFAKQLLDSDSNSITTMNGGLRTVAVICALVLIMFCAMVAGYVWITMTDNSVRCLRYAAFFTLVFFFLFGWSMLVVLSVLATDGLYQTFSYCGLLAPIFEVIAFITGGKYESTWKLVVTSLARLPLLTGYILLGLAINNFI